jgi:hypothetical protein
MKLQKENDRSIGRTGYGAMPHTRFEYLLMMGVK